MKRSILALTLAACALAPHAASAQSFGIAVRGGTLGVGGEAAIGLLDRVVIRGGIGLTPVKKIEATIDDIDMELELPKTWYNVGLDLYLTSVVRLGGGMLFKPDDLTLIGTPAAPVDVGGRTFTPEEIGTLTGTLESGDRAPYVLIGFGKHTAGGFGLSLDLGAAFLREPAVSLDAEGGTFSDSAEMRARLDDEAQRFEDEVPTYLKIWPILNLGLRFGIG